MTHSSPDEPSAAGLPSSRQAGFAFRVEAAAPGDPGARRARAGCFSTPHGDVRTPAFMPVGTRGTVKGVLPRDIGEVGSTMILANTLHLHEAGRTRSPPGGCTASCPGTGRSSPTRWVPVFSMADISTLTTTTFKSIVDGDRIRSTSSAPPDPAAPGPDV